MQTRQKVLLFIFVSAFIIGAILTTAFIVLRPRAPIFTVDSLSASNLNASSSQITTFNLHFTANPNRWYHALYDDVEARVLYRSSMIAQNQLPPLDQGPKSQSRLEAMAVGVSSYIPSDFAGDRKKNGSVEFRAQVLANVRFKAAGGWRFPGQMFIMVFCEDLPVKMKVDGSGIFSGGPKRCLMGVFVH